MDLLGDLDRISAPILERNILAPRLVKYASMSINYAWGCAQRHCKEKGVEHKDSVWVAAQLPPSVIHALSGTADLDTLHSAMADCGKRAHMDLRSSASYATTCFRAATNRQRMRRHAFHLGVVWALEDLPDDVLGQIARPFEQDAKRCLHHELGNVHGFIAHVRQAQIHHSLAVFCRQACLGQVDDWGAFKQHWKSNQGHDRHRAAERHDPASCAAS